MAVSWVVDGTRSQRLVPLASECAPSIGVSEVYFEVAYGPLIGPTSVALARNLARRTASASGAVHVDLVEIALEIGLRASRLEPPGRSSSISRAFDRLHHHRLLTVLADGVIGTYVSVPPLDEAYVGHIPDAAQLFHRTYLSAVEAASP